MILFNEGPSIVSLFEKKKACIKTAIEQYDYKQLKDFNEENFNSFATLGVIPPVIIDFNNPNYYPSHGKMEVYNRFHFDFEKEYVTVDSLDVYVKIEVLQGNELLRYQPATQMFFLSSPEVNMGTCVGSNKTHITFTMQFRLTEIKDLDADSKRKKTQEAYNESIYCCKERMDTLNKEIESFNKSLPNYVKTIIEDKINKDSILDSFSSAIGVELTPKNADREKGKKILVTPKKHTPTLPDKKYYDGYYFDSANYNTILQTIREHLISTETLPKPIQKLSDEELIRDTILWALNANYIIATGETFRAAGKTDINVNFNNRAAFLGECKVWNGPSTFSEALTQLYGYSTWRECRVAILIFNLHNKDFGALLSKLNNEITTHKNYVSGSKKAENEWECKFKKETDCNSFLTINIIASDYCSRKN